ELGFGKAPLKVALLDALDQVPADVEVMGHIEDGHAPRQFQDVALEGLGGALPGFGEGDLDLTDQATGSAFDPRAGQLHDGGPAADGQPAEAAALGAAGDDVAAAAGGAAAVGGILSDGEVHLAALVVGADVVIATDAEGMVQQAGGHADLPVWSRLTQLPVE